MSDALKRFTFDYVATCKDSYKPELNGTYAIDEEADISYNKLMDVAAGAALNSFEYDHKESREDYIVNIVIQAS